METIYVSEFTAAILFVVAMAWLMYDVYCLIKKMNKARNIVIVIYMATILMAAYIAGKFSVAFVSVISKLV